MQPKPPTPEQIENAALMGFEYIGDGIFIRGDEIGYFTERGFVRE